MVVIKHSDIAFELFRSGQNCAQSVFAAFSDVTGLDKTTSLKIASSFGGGMGKLREVCGTVTASLAVIGILYGYAEHDQKAKEIHYALVRRVAEEFSAVHGTYICRDLLKGIAGTGGLNPAVRDEKYYKVRPCIRFVVTACDILDGIIAERSAEKSDKTGEEK